MKILLRCAHGAGKVDFLFSWQEVCGPKSGVFEHVQTIIAAGVMSDDIAQADELTRSQVFGVFEPGQEMAKGFGLSVDVTDGTDVLVMNLSLEGEPICDKEAGAKHVDLIKSAAPYEGPLVTWDALWQFEKIVWICVHQGVEEGEFLVRCQIFPFDIFCVDVANWAEPRLCNIETKKIVFVAKNVKSPKTDVSTAHDSGFWSIRRCDFFGHVRVFEDLINFFWVFEKVVASKNRKESESCFIGSKAKLGNPGGFLGHSVLKPNFSRRIMMAVGVRPFLWQRSTSFAPLIQSFVNAVS